MKLEKLIIESDGTKEGTFLKVNGEKIKYLTDLSFSLDCEDKFPKISINVARLANGGVVKTKKVKVRDSKTEKIVEKDKIVSVPLVLEREI